MNATSVERPYHVLLAWPEPYNTALWHALRALSPLITVEFCTAATLPARLGVADYYHILHLSPLQWRAFSSAEQRRIATHISLIILGPEAALAEDLACARAGLYFPETQPLEIALNAVCEFHAQLAEDGALGSALAATGGRLALVGNARCLDTEPPAAPEPDNTATAVDPPSAAIAGVSGVKNVDIVIRKINVNGDMVMGSKYVQQAGGDQVNINRMEGASGGIATDATGNPPSPLHQRVCQGCGHAVESADYRFCQHCGHKLEDMV